MLSSCTVLSENTQLIVNHPGLRPDILVTAPDRSPVVIEAEYLPALTAEKEARDRLGLEVSVNPRPIEAAVALRHPEDVANVTDLRSAVRNARLSYCVFTVEAFNQTPVRQIQSIARFPQTGWLEGAVGDLADLIRLVSVPQSAVDNAARAFQQGINNTSRMLDEEGDARPAVTAGVARILGMSNVPQTRKMACAIIANAMVFHVRIAGMHHGIKQLHQVCGPDAANPQREIMNSWADILKINYWPIFHVARCIVGELSPGCAARLIRVLQLTVNDVTSSGIDNSHDLTGKVFQRLIADRKFLATFYTRPESAALLARLAVAKMEQVDWSDAAAIGKLRIGDFACGTGALLSAVYDQVAARHERAGGSPADLHRVMMEEALYGCDVMPSAIHITGATLAGTQPKVGFSQCRLYGLPYGRSEKGAVAIGSLELLTGSSTFTALDMNDPALRTGSAGDELATQVIADVPHDSFDLVIMNPPFTNNAAKEAGNIGVFAPAFAAFGSTDQDQREMAKRLSRITAGTCYHGNAGIASAFAALAHRKLKPGGVLALVLPLSAAAGLSWRGVREMLARNYTDLTVMSIAAADNDDLSFSSDTGMAECLIVARKLKIRESGETRPHFASLSRRPKGFIHASLLAQNILDSAQTRTIEDGPYGGTAMTIGNETAGEMLTAASQLDGESWGAVRLTDYSLAQTAYALSNSKLWLPGSPTAVELKTTKLNSAGRLGLHHRDINGPPPRAPFVKTAYNPTATYPCLWNHNAPKETRMVCIPDSQLRVIQGLEEKSANVWSTASRGHLNRDFRFNSQPLTVAFTEQASIGGRAWPNVIFSDLRFDYLFALWCNCTLGLLSYWWHSNRQQSGRGITSIRAAGTMPVLDFHALTDEQLANGQTVFAEFGGRDFKPAYLADADPNRALLDRRMICDLLGFDEETYMAVRRLSAKWCAEPSVHGGKPRPRGAKLVM